MDEPREPETPPAAGTPAGGGRRLLAAALTLPWVVLYGVIGTWAVAVALRGMADGVPHLDAGYQRPVTPGGLLLVGLLVLAGFAVLLAAAVLVLAGVRSRAPWTAVLVAASLLTGGSVWAAVEGGLHPLLWLLFFFGLVEAVALAAWALLHVPPGPQRDRMAPP
jgi:hypothetical protein